MPCPRSLAVALAGAALGLAACGGDSPPPRCTPHPSPSPLATTAGQLSGALDRAALPLGGSVQATVRVSGPLVYQAPCNAPLSLIVVDTADIHVDSQAPPAPKGTPCGAVSLAAGQSAEYDVVWNADPTLPTGAYRLVLALGDQPQLVLVVHLGIEVVQCLR
jgi:hypothetical protein